LLGLSWAWQCGEVSEDESRKGKIQANQEGTGAEGRAAMRALRKWTLWILLLLLLPGIGIPAFRIVRDIWQHQRDRALIAAVKKKDAAVVKTLLEQGADANTRDSEEPPPSLWQRVMGLFFPKPSSKPSGLPALLLTVPDCDRDIARLLLKRGAEVDTKDEYGRTPLVALLERIDFRVEGGGDSPVPPYAPYARLLIEAGADVNAPSETGTPLNLVIRIQDLELARLLLERGARANQEDAFGGTPLMIAVSDGNADIVQMLLKAHADVSRRDEHGQTALSIAKEHLTFDAESKEALLKIIRMLRQAGAKQ
jgi:hypothetical protein